MTIIVPEWVVGIAIVMWLINTVLGYVKFYYTEVKPK